MSRYSQASERVASIYRSELNKLTNKLDMSVHNAIYYELVKESAQSFSDGWTEATAYILSHPGCTIDEILEAKSEELKNRYPYLEMVKNDE